MALGRGRIPVSLVEPATLAGRIRAALPAGHARRIEFVAPPSCGVTGSFWVEAEEGRMRRFTWMDQGSVRLDLRYEAFRAVGAAILPSGVAPARTR